MGPARATRDCAGGMCDCPVPRAAGPASPDTIPPMPVLRLHAVGEWAPGALRTRWVRATRVVPADVQKVIDQEWAEASARPGVRLFDGPMCRLESWRAAPAGGLE